MIRLDNGEYIRLSKHVGLDPHTRRPTGDGKVRMKNPKRGLKFYAQLVERIESLEFMDVLRVKCSFEKRMKTSTIISYHFNKTKVLFSRWHKDYLYIVCIEPVKGEDPCESLSVEPPTKQPLKSSVELSTRLHKSSDLLRELHSTTESIPTDEAKRTSMQLRNTQSKST